MRNVTNWQVYAAGSQPDLKFGRGYTGHEHLNQFGLINMNARLYDPMLGRFLAADPLVSTTLDFNRYVYARNNPMMFTDPTGESWKSFWRDFGNAFARDFKKTFGGVNGIEIGYNSSGGGFVNATRSGASFGSSVGISNSRQLTTGNSNGGFHEMQSVNLESELEHSIVISEYNGRLKYFGAMAFAHSLSSRFNSIATEFSNWTSNVGIAGSMFMDWATGTGETTRTFKNDNVTDDMKNAPGVNKARNYFYNVKYKDVTNLDGASLNNFSPGFFGPIGAYNAGVHPIQQYVGGYSVNIKSFEGYLHFQIYNRTSLKSFLFDIGPAWDRSTFAPFGNMYQYYYWKEAIKQNR